MRLVYGQSVACLVGEILNPSTEANMLKGHIALVLSCPTYSGFTAPWQRANLGGGRGRDREALLQYGSLAIALPDIGANSLGRLFSARL